MFGPLLGSRVDTTHCFYFFSILGLFCPIDISSNFLSDIKQKKNLGRLERHEFGRRLFWRIWTAVVFFKVLLSLSTCPIYISQFTKTKIFGPVSGVMVNLQNIFFDEFYLAKGALRAGPGVDDAVENKNTLNNLQV